MHNQPILKLASSPTCAGIQGSSWVGGVCLHHHCLPPNMPPPLTPSVPCSLTSSCQPLHPVALGFFWALEPILPPTLQTGVPANEWSLDTASTRCLIPQPSGDVTLRLCVVHTGPQGSPVQLGPPRCSQWLEARQTYPLLPSAPSLSTPPLSWLLPETASQVNRLHGNPCLSLYVWRITS